MYLPSNTPILQDQRESAARHGAESDARIQAMRRTAACGRARLFNTLVAPNQVADTIGMGTAVNTQKLQNQTEVSRAVGILGTGGQLDATGSSSSSGPSIAQIIAGAPEVVSLNRGGGCNTPSYKPVPLGPDPRPGMPQRAPTIVQTSMGAMNYRGADSTIPGAQANYAVNALPMKAYSQGRTSVNAMPMQAFAPGRASSQSSPSALPVKAYYEILNRGLTGYAPPWSDAGVLPNGGLPGSPDMGVGAWLMDNPWMAMLIAGAGVYALSRRNKAGR